MDKMKRSCNISYLLDTSLKFNHVKKPSKIIQRNHISVFDLIKQRIPHSQNVKSIDICLASPNKYVFYIE